MKILGAGLAGLLAGVLNQNAFILEPFSHKKSHQALLRFRSPDIGEAVGIPFKKVRVYKGIWDNGPVDLDPMYISQYAKKVSGKIAYRSICDVSSTDRWIAPIDFQERLEEMCLGRISYDCDVSDEPILPDKIISTLPIYVLARMLDVEMPKKIQIESETKSIFVNRYEIPNCEAYMTVYFPSPHTSVYRASISGNMLIVESVAKAGEDEIDQAADALGIELHYLYLKVGNFEQENGKISPIDEAWRKEFILNATLKHDIYSLGRFATWRNLVLDDVYRDILRIKQFINRDKYDHHKDY